MQWPYDIIIEKMGNVNKTYWHALAGFVFTRDGVEMFLDLLESLTKELFLHFQTCL